MRVHVPVTVDLDEQQNWMHVVRVERILGRKLTDEERAAVLKEGENAVLKAGE